jgi:hypothetical protein
LRELVDELRLHHSQDQAEPKRRQDIKGKPAGFASLALSRKNRLQPIYMGEIDLRRAGCWPAFCPWSGKPHQER